MLPPVTSLLAALTLHSSAPLVRLLRRCHYSINGSASQAGGKLVGSEHNELMTPCRTTSRTEQISPASNGRMLSTDEIMWCRGQRLDARTGARQPFSCRPCFYCSESSSIVSGWYLKGLQRRGYREEELNVEAAA
jgi:hypothetical protein